MYTNRPKIKVPFQAIDIIIELCCITLLVLIFVFVIIEYQNLPDIIASHFNAAGEADGFSNKNVVWLLPLLGLVMYVGLFFLNKFPHLHNYMMNITEKNALKNYRLSTRFVRWTTLFCLIVFSVVIYQMIEVSKGNETKILGIPFLIFTIGLPILGIAFMFYYQNKINK